MTRILLIAIGTFNAQGQKMLNESYCVQFAPVSLNCQINNLLYNQNDFECAMLCSM